MVTEGIRGDNTKKHIAVRRGVTNTITRAPDGIRNCYTMSRSRWHTSARFGRVRHGGGVAAGGGAVASECVCVRCDGHSRRAGTGTAGK